MFDRRILTAVIVAAAASIGFLWLTNVPLGVVGPPHEWSWARNIVLEGQVADAVLGAAIAAAVGLCYLIVAAVGARRLERAMRVETALWLLVLSAAGFFWLFAVQESPPSPYGLSKTPWVVYYKGPSGYYFEARYEMGDTATYLAGYRNRISDSARSDRVLHIGTHPPGLFVLHRAAIELCQRSPRFSQRLIDSQPESVVAALDSIAPYAAGTKTPLMPYDRAALWLLAIVTQLVAVATIFPLYAVLRRDFSRVTAWRAIAFWPLVPAVAVFLPKTDALYPFLGMTFLALWLVGRERRSAFLCVSAGLVYGLGMCLSLAVLPYAALAAMLSLWEVWRRDSQHESLQRQLARTGLSAMWSLVGFFVPVAILAAAFDLVLPAVWLRNLQNHAEFYSQYPRTYWKWLIGNPVELSFAVGLPIVVLIIFAFWKAFRSESAVRRRTMGPLIACVAVWGLLWLSGKNMGEAARLWIVIQPWCIWLTAASLGDATVADEPLARRASGQSMSTGCWLTILLTQIAVCIATVARVRGFDFTGG